MENNILHDAESAMKARDFKQAIALFEAHLSNHPDDIKPMLQLGICHLLTNSTGAFTAIYSRVAALFLDLGQIPSELKELWGKYGALAKKAGATALIAGTVMSSAATSGCGKPHSAHKYSAGVYKEPKPMTVDKMNTEQTTPGEPKEPQDSMAQPEKPPMKYSLHRYSGGAYIDRNKE
ncbi:hypothetical protein KKF84_12305 [Myxococcota bacterium]|nr:hypothetical protein [Myxococcota bacterium]